MEKYSFMNGIGKSGSNISTKEIYHYFKHLSLYKNQNLILSLTEDQFPGGLMKLLPRKISALRSWLTFEPHENPLNQIAVHIRRGDVDPIEYPKRYLYNKYYINLLKKILKQLETIDKNKLIINICKKL